MDDISKQRTLWEALGKALAGARRGSLTSSADETTWHRIEAPHDVQVAGVGTIRRGTMITRRRLPDGSYEYRFTDEDCSDELDRMAW